MTPPRLASALVRLCAPPDDRTFVVQDLADEYARLAATRGPRHARAWYWRQVAGSVRPLLVERVRRHARRGNRVPHWRGDTAQAWRWLVRNPGLTTTMAATLIIGLTTTLAASLLLYVVILRPLPYPDSRQLVDIAPAGPRLPRTVRVVSLPDLPDYQAGASSFAALSGYSALTFTLAEAGEPRHVEGLRVGPRFSEVLGITPVLGRDFAPADFVQGSHYVALLSDGFWRRAFGASPDVVGQRLVLDDRRYVIVGVLPDLPFEDITAPHEFWVPLVARPGVFWEPIRGNGFVSLVGRLAPGVTLPAAQDQLSAVAAQLARTYPRSNETKTAVSLRPLHAAVVAPVRQALLLLFAAVAAVLLVSCGNLANLLLAHAERRRHEFAIRLAVGAEPHRLRSQVLIETASIAAPASAAALLLAPLVARGFLQLYPMSVPGTADLGIGPAITLSAAVLCAAIATALACPQVRRLHQVSMPSAAPRSTGTRRDRRGRAVLIAVQVAFTLVLAFGGVALVRSMLRLSAVAPGFDPQGLVAVGVSPSPGRFGSAAATRGLFEQLLEEVRAMPGVRNAAVSTAVPFVNQGWAFPVPSPDGAPEPVLVTVTIASSGFFETLGVPVRRGRLFQDAEHTGEHHVVVLNEPAARLLPYADPIGRTLRYSGIDWTVAGVVAPVRQAGLRTPPRPELFLPWGQAGRAPQRLIARIDGDPAPVLRTITARLRELDPAGAAPDVMRLDARIQRSVAADRFRTVLLACLATIGVILAGLGVWSVTAYVVARQERENGIRMALGASGRQVLGGVVAGTLRPALLGLAAGLIVSFWMAPVLESFLFEVEARDPLTLTAACAAVLASAVAAALLPARRALQADPAAALRSQ